MSIVDGLIDVVGSVRLAWKLSCQSVFVVDSAFIFLDYFNRYGTYKLKYLREYIIAINKHIFIRVEMLPCS